MSSSSVVTIHVGQCGNQVGARFWETVAQDIDECLFSQGRARAVLIDMEPGVLDAISASRLGRKLFDRDTQYVYDSSGSGNNWATGHYVFGCKHGDRIEEAIRHQVELADNRVSAFVMTYSLSGGTGSGLGSFVLEMLADVMGPKIDRIASVLFPSYPNDVVTGPYNCVLATAALNEFGSTVVTANNDGLAKYSNTSLNAPIANVLIDVLAPTRFPDTTESHFGETTSNRFYVPSWSTQHFGGFNPQLAGLGNPRLGSDSTSVWISSSDKQRAQNNLARYYPIRESSHVCWRRNFPSTSISTLTTTERIKAVFKLMMSGFDKMFKRKAHLHHYSDIIDVEEMREALNCVKSFS